jgi:hypothetical protein
MNTNISFITSAIPYRTNSHTKVIDSSHLRIERRRSEDWHLGVKIQVLVKINKQLMMLVHVQLVSVVLSAVSK